jgi:cyclophilin family peptidyl-prolyl cis-trans isomerase
MRTLPLAALLLALPLSAQAKPKSKPKPKVEVPVPAAAPAVAPAPAPEPTPAPKPKPRVKFETSYGPIVVELEPELAPATVANFLRYVQEGHYAGTIFHRVIPGFMVQGGGLAEDLSEKPTHASIPNEAPATFKAGLKNTPGTLAMARQTDPQSATAQFYINTNTNTVLDHKAMTADGYGYCVFGHVVEGMEAVAKIEKVNTIWRRGMQNVPEYAVRIKSAELLPEK